MPPRGWTGSGPPVLQRVDFPRETALHASHPIGVEETTRRRAVQEGDGLAEAGLSLLRGLGRMNVFDGRADVRSLRPVHEPGGRAQLHALLATFDSRHSGRSWSGSSTSCEHKKLEETADGING